MGAKVNNLIIRFGSLLAGMALILAIGGAGRGCWFMYHQPKVPDELK